MDSLARCVSNLRQRFPGADLQQAVSCDQQRSGGLVPVTGPKPRALPDGTLEGVLAGGRAEGGWGGE